MKEPTKEGQQVLQAVGQVMARIGAEDSRRAWAMPGQVAKVLECSRADVVAQLQKLERLGLVKSKASNGTRLYRTAAGGAA